MYILSYGFVKFDQNIPSRFGKIVMDARVLLLFPDNAKKLCIGISICSEKGRSSNVHLARMHKHDM